MSRLVKYSLSAAVLATLVGCQPDYSPNSYSSDAVQQANKVEPGIVVGFRQVKIRADGTVGAVTGGAAGGVLGAQTGSSNVSSALGAVGGSVVGGLVGSAVEHVTGDTSGWEYIVRKTDGGGLLSVTQKEERPIAVGQKVLVIFGNQARVVADYSTGVDQPPAPETGQDKPAVKAAPAAAAQPRPDAPAKPAPPPEAAASPPPEAPAAASPPAGSPTAATPAPAADASPGAPPSSDADGPKEPPATSAP